MGTPFETIIGKFLAKIESYELFELGDDELEEEVLPLLETATSEFMLFCYQDITDTDFTGDSFPVKLNLIEQEILTEYMLRSYVKINTANLEAFERTLTSRDYREYSQANILNSKLELLKTIEENIEKLLSRYSYRDRKLIDKYAHLFK